MLKVLALVLALAPSALRAGLSIPTVDINTHQTGAVAMIAIWSGTSTTISAGSTLSLGFPSGWNLPAGLNIAACGCVFIKHTLTGTAGTFTVNEVTITAGSKSGNDMVITLPVDLAPGPFYVRLDDYAAVPNPSLAGQATLTIGLGPVVTESKPVSFVNGAEGSPGEISGLVTHAGIPVKGALVIASTDTTLIDAAPSLELGPAAGTVTAKPVDLQRLMAVTGADGRYTLKLPYNVSTTYNVAAIYGGSAQGNAVNLKSNLQVVDIDSSTLKTVNLSNFSVCVSN